MTSYDFVLTLVNLKHQQNKIFDWNIHESESFLLKLKIQNKKIKLKRTRNGGLGEWKGKKTHWISKSLRKDPIKDRDETSTSGTFNRYLVYLRVRTPRDPVVVVDLSRLSLFFTLPLPLIH